MVLNIFALIVLLVLIAAVVAVWVILGMMPGKIARERNHPQADAINVCGWWGVITMGILLPWPGSGPTPTPGGIMPCRQRRQLLKQIDVIKV